MARMGMVFDLKRCIGCNACVIGCKQENSLPDGVFFTKTLSEDYGVYPSVKRVYIPTLCNHCEDAPCEKVCPSGATYTRDDGIVMVDDEKCIGCGSCAVACPYDQRSQVSKDMLDRGLFGEGQLTDFEKQGYDRFTPGTVIKCDFCSNRVDAGLDPACVVTCPTNARIFGDFDDPDSKPNRVMRERGGGQAPLAEKNTKPKVYYIS
ncbi:MAG: 4Fe-4S dicluster domain-containing protein [Candidatus Thiodiazotropha sp. (ex Lucinoma borealis)]|nr:4Fe-4S dicluster domain-containing protein [Candidatus Thiodiazotropha sp. (ex Lucinoma borealis)]MCU7855411.1 4Fe-4S dicluster domain-containing protein [Candidatus Thiodiazotropha sp. (ex Lucinoma borealis)]